MASAQREERRDDRRRRRLRRMGGATRPIDQPSGAGRVVAVDPFIGRLSTDAVASRQVRDVELVALVIRDELHALIHE